MTRSLIICICKNPCIPFIDWSHALRNAISVFPTVPEDSVILGGRARHTNECVEYLQTETCGCSNRQLIQNEQMMVDCLCAP